MIFSVEFTKKIMFISLFAPRFFIGKLIEVAKLFLIGREEEEGEGGGLTKVKILSGGRWWGTCKTNRDEQGVGRRSKIGSFEQTYFLNVPMRYWVQFGFFYFLRIYQIHALQKHDVPMTI